MNTSDQKNHTSNQEELTTDMGIGTFIELLQDNLSTQKHLPKATIEHIARRILDHTRRNSLCRTPGMIRNAIHYILEEHKHLN